MKPIMAQTQHTTAPPQARAQCAQGWLSIYTHCAGRQKCLYVKGMCVHLHNSNRTNACAVIQGYLSQKHPLACTLPISMHTHKYMNSHVCTHMHAYTHMCVHMYTSIHKCTQIYTYVGIHTCIHTQACTHMHMQIHTRIYMYTHVCKYTHVYTCTHTCHLPQMTMLAQTQSHSLESPQLSPPGCQSRTAP